MYKGKWIYTIYDPRMQEQYRVIETVSADLLDHSEFPKLMFRDEQNNLLALHYMAPGTSVYYTDQDGYTVQELIERKAQEIKGREV